MGAGGDAVAGKSAVVGGLDVEGGITDQAGLIRAGVEGIESVTAESGRRFVMGRIERAENAVKPPVESEVAGDFTGPPALLVGEDGKRFPFPLQCSENPRDARMDGDVFKVDLAEMLAEEANRVEEGISIHEMSHGVLHRAADGRPEDFAGRNLPSQRAEREFVAPEDHVEMIDQRAVEIE